MTPTTTHLIRVDRLAFWSRRPGQWQARCGTCAWDGRFESRDAAVRAGERHREIVGGKPTRAEDDDA